MGEMSVKAKAAELHWKISGKLDKSKNLYLNLYSVVFPYLVKAFKASRVRLFYFRSRKTVLGLSCHHPSFEI